MKEQKVIITNDEEKINNLLKDFWKIISVTPQVVSSGSNRGSNNNLYGLFCFVLEKIEI
jgi:hypothetical protein